VPPDLDIKQLCDGAGVTPRTVHYYIQQGLLPGAGTTGSGARYSPDHLDRLRLIRLLQNEHLPLAEINRRLRRLSGDEVRALLEERKRVRDPSKGSALEYIRNILKPHPDQAASDRSPLTSHSASSASQEASVEAGLGRSQWERIDLADGLELNVRRPLTRQQQRKLEKLLASAREIFEEP
jgi:DNA-binding transcriptional MerR regulator